MHETFFAFGMTRCALLACRRGCCGTGRRRGRLNQRGGVDRGTGFGRSGGLGYRKRFKGPDDQIHADAHVGWAPGGAWTFVAGSANTLGIGSDRGAREVLTTAPSFRRHEAQLIANYRFTDRVSASPGVSTTYAGESVGVGRSGFVSLVSTS